MRFFLCIVLIGMSQVALAGEPFVGGERDSVTPQIRIIQPGKNIKAAEPITVQLEISDGFDFCGSCATNAATEYLAEGQVDGQGHVHVYIQSELEEGFAEDRTPEVFCVFNQNNITTEEIAPNIWQAVCPAVPSKGNYRMCATMETNAHGSRMKASPRHFPSIDCQSLHVVGGGK